jgi:hypothetical protein
MKKRYAKRNCNVKEVLSLNISVAVTGSSGVVELPVYFIKALFF